MVVNCTDEGCDAGGEALTAMLASVERGTGELGVGIARPESGQVSLPAFGGDVWLIPSE